MQRNMRDTKTSNELQAARGVIYARYSSSGQREESIEGQIRECREYAKRHNIVIVGEYCDHAISGTSDKRPEFQRLIKDSAKGQFAFVITWKGDRFARNRYDARFTSTDYSKTVYVFYTRKNLFLTVPRESFLNLSWKALQNIIPQTSAKTSNAECMIRL